MPSTAPVPMTASVQEIPQWMPNHEGGGKDHSAIAPLDREAESEG